MKKVTMVIDYEDEKHVEIDFDPNDEVEIRVANSPTSPQKLVWRSDDT